MLLKYKVINKLMLICTKNTMGSKGIATINKNTKQYNRKTW